MGTSRFLCMTDLFFTMSPGHRLPPGLEEWAFGRCMSA